MIPPPMALIAELTHRCPLRCVYCSNPLEIAARSREISAPEWLRVIGEAARLGVLQISFTGGEPLLRDDLTDLVRASSAAGLYVNLITSGIGFTQTRCDSLAEAGVDHVQLSFQDVDRAAAKRISGVDVIEKKKIAAEILRRSEMAMTVNIVVHRENVSRLGEMIEFAVSLGAGKIEVAHVQFNGWAILNRGALLPTAAQVKDSMAIISAAQRRYAGACRIDFVLPDYYAKYPKPCMGGWARKMILVDPQGRVLPCHSAATIPGVELPSVRTHALEEIWQESELFNMFRGTDWMPEACRDCARKEQDYGGCRCQALALAGRADQTDPVCHKSPARTQVDQLIATSLQASAPLRHRPFSLR